MKERCMCGAPDCSDCGRAMGSIRCGKCGRLACDEHEGDDSGPYEPDVEDHHDYAERMERQHEASVKHWGNES